jgi:hypothetical protein
LGDLEDEYHSAVELSDNQRARAIAAELTVRIAKELSRLSVNAPNWYTLVSQVYSPVFIYVSRDVLRSAEIARRMLWTDRDVPLKDFATINSA